MCYWVQGPALPYLAPAYNSQQLPGSGRSPGPAPGCRAPPGRPHEALSLLALLRHHWRGTAPPRPFDEGLAANLWTFFLAPKPHTYRWGQGHGLARAVGQNMGMRHADGSMDH